MKSKYLQAHLFAMMGITLTILSNNILFTFFGGIGISLALDLARKSGIEIGRNERD